VNFGHVWPPDSEQAFSNLVSLPEYSSDSEHGLFLSPNFDGDNDIDWSSLIDFGLDDPLENLAQSSSFELSAIPSPAAKSTSKSSVEITLPALSPIRPQVVIPSLQVCKHCGKSFSPERLR
jgi:hypothetical protein